MRWFRDQTLYRIRNCCGIFGKKNFSMNNIFPTAEGLPVHLII